MNHRAKTTFVRAFAALWIVCLVLIAAAQDPTVADLVGKMPARNAIERNNVTAELVRIGPAGIMEICRMLVPPGAGDDTKARFALSGLVMYVSRAGAEAEREMVAGVLIGALESATDKEVKAFLIHQLQLAGKEEAVAPLSKLLTDKRLCEPATQALLAIRTPSVSAALLKALPSMGDPSRVTIIKALGELRSEAAANQLIRYAASDDSNTRLAALYAIANIGDRSAGDVLAQAAQATSSYERTKATSFYLLYARRLAEAGRKGPCARICRDLITTRTDPREVNVRCAALSTLASTLGRLALKDLLAAVDSESKEFRAAALELASYIPGKATTRKWIKRLENASPQARLEILAMLGHRGDPSALPVLLKALNDRNAAIRLTAIPAAARLGGNEALPALLAALQSADRTDEIKSIKGALLRLPGKEAVSAIADALPSMPRSSRIALLEVLAERRAKAHVEVVFVQTEDEDQSIRVAAIKALGGVATEKDQPRLVKILLHPQSDSERSAAQNAVVSVARRIDDPERRADALLAVIKKTTSVQRRYVLETLASVGGKRALDAVVAETKNNDNTVKETAIRALADWPDVSAAPELLNVIRATKNRTHQELALHGCVDLVGAAKLGPDEKISMYKDALTVIKLAEDKKLVLASLADVRHIAALEPVVPYLDDEALREEAALAIVKIACPVKERDKGLRGPEVYEALEKVIEVAENPDIRDAARKHFATLTKPAPGDKPDAEGFMSLFNGKDLSGWIGNTKGYVAEDGKLVCKPGGNLYTRKEYSDFILRFEFKLTPGANNGLGIRTPPRGDAAYVGMELQILDDTADIYKNLQPYQYHGSIYGVVPAKRGHLKPVGEWNYQEVTAKGRQITVKLNGATIVDADIDKAGTPRTMDGRNHPGLKCNKGHIGFLGHDSRVEFRNIRIRELK